MDQRKTVNRKSGNPPKVEETEITKRINKLAQYFRILPCPYTQQIFCYSACLLKWFKLEQARMQAYAAMQESLKQTAKQAVVADLVGEVDGEERPPEDVPQEEIPIDVPTNEPEIRPTVVDVPVSEIVPTESGGEIETDQNLTKEEDVLSDDVEESKFGAAEIDGEGVKEEDKLGEVPAIVPEESTAPTVALTKPAILRIPYANSNEKRLSWNLAFAAMKYSEILEKVLEEVSFYNEYPEFRDDEYLVLVTLYDYTARNYQRRSKTDNDRDVLEPDDVRPAKYAGRVFIYPPVTELFQQIEQAVLKTAVHFAASVARIRVKEQVGSLRLLLPAAWREAEALAEVMPFYAWYNQLNGKQEVVTNWLKANNFTKINNGTPGSMQYTNDVHCPDAFVFNSQNRTLIIDSQIVKEKHLIVQDKSIMFGVHCMLSFMGGGEEILFANTVNSLCGIHMEGLLSNKFPTVQPVPQIRVCRQSREDDDPKIFSKSGSKSTKMLTDDFITLPPTVEPYKSMKHIFLEASDTRSAVASPIDYIEAEGDELAILKDMWTPDDNPQKATKQLELISKTSGMLKHALKFSQARTVFFLSHSIHSEETDNIVTKCLEYTNRTLVREAEAMISSSKTLTSAPAFILRLPLLPVIAEAKEDFLQGKPSFVTANNTIRFPPSVNGNGFYLACFKKEVTLMKDPDDIKTEDDSNDTGDRRNIQKRQKSKKSKK